MLIWLTQGSERRGTLWRTQGMTMPTKYSVKTGKVSGKKPYKKKGGKK